MLALVIGFIGGVVVVAREWAGPLRPVTEIHLEPTYLPLYALFSLTRGVVAYAISFVFTLAYGDIMARVSGTEKVLLPALDILQSIPVLGFLPGFVLGLVHLFPHLNLGLELASVLMIFTGQVWNMTFSFYASLKSVPPELTAVSQLARLTWWQRFVRLDLSFAATGLVWNSMMSMAGGWFFLIVSESFVLGRQDFRLPGLGSYVSLAMERGDIRAQVLGVLAMLAMIASVDQLVWRPVVAWAQKFTDEEQPGVESAWLWSWLRRAKLWRATGQLLAVGRRRLAQTRTRAGPDSTSPSGVSGAAYGWLRHAVVFLAGLGGLVGLAIYIQLIASLHPSDWLQLGHAAAATFCRVLCAVALGSLWAIPVGVWIGRNPRWSNWVQPLIQMAASFPAPMIFPLVVGGLLHFGVGLGASAIVLLLLGTHWYLLFNVIAGTTAIPRELWEFSRLSRRSRLERWTKLILPGIFPALLTGWVTATGGAWNACIVAEYMKHAGQTLSTVGLGATINQATEQGNFALLAAAVGVMALIVVGFNRLVWRPLSHRAQTRFTLAT